MKSSHCGRSVITIEVQMLHECCITGFLITVHHRYKCTVIIGSPAHPHLHRRFQILSKFFSRTPAMLTCFRLDCLM